MKLSSLRKKAERVFGKLARKGMRIESVTVDHITYEDYVLNITAKIDSKLMRGLFSMIGASTSKETSIDPKHFPTLEQYFAKTFQEINRKSEARLDNPFRMVNYHVSKATHIPSLTDEHTIILLVVGSYVTLEKN